MDPTGWYLPKGDTYFAQFVEGPAPKKNGFQREHLLEAFKFVKQWRVAIDVGAHVGFWTWDMASRFERVFAFEAAQDTYDCLVKNIAECHNVTTANFAIGAESGRATVMDDPDRPPGNTGSRYVVPGGDVPMVPLDALTMFGGCDLLKIDVEGYELQVLQGARELVEAFHPVIIMECDKRFTHRYGVAHGSAEKLLEAAGYKRVAHMQPDKVFAWS